MSATNAPIKTEDTLQDKASGIDPTETRDSSVPVAACSKLVQPVCISKALTVPNKHVVPLPPSITVAPITAAKVKAQKKKKTHPAVTMATAPAASSSGSQGENTGRWTAEEHRLFLQGLEQHGKGWKKIASLIKSRTVVQIRTHAQKYFQKLAKARQNGEEGDVPMEGRNGATAIGSGIPSVAIQSTKRRRQTTGTKRKAISSVVASAQRQGKKMAAAQAAAGVKNPSPPLPAVAPALAPFVAPNGTSIAAVPSVTTSHGTISGPALEDSLFRFLTPVPVASDQGQVNDVARQAGANPITLPSDNPSTAPSAGDSSPTGVADYPLYPSWTDAKDLPTWYAKGGDVDSLLDMADALDWIADSGDLNETYEPPKSTSSEPSVPSLASGVEDDDDLNLPKAPPMPSLSTDALATIESSAAIQTLPTLFDNAAPASKKQKLSHDNLIGGSNSDDHLEVFDTPMEEHAFVSALLDNTGESSGSLPVFS